MSTRKIELTGNVSAKSMSFVVDENVGTLHTAWYTLLELTDGTEIHVKDESSSIGLMEAKTEYEAIKKGRKYLEKRTMSGGNTNEK